MKRPKIQATAACCMNLRDWALRSMAIAVITLSGFATSASAEPVLLFAAGGGGGANESDTPGGAGQAGPSGQAGSGQYGGAGGVNGLGGSGGNSPSGFALGGGGGGWLGNGTAGGGDAGKGLDGENGLGGQGYASGFAGGLGGLTYAYNSFGDGGYGGGGGGGYAGGGGGGGYSGGGGSLTNGDGSGGGGGGGGSFADAGAIGVTITGGVNGNNTLPDVNEETTGQDGFINIGGFLFSFTGAEQTYTAAVSGLVSFIIDGAQGGQGVFAVGGYGTEITASYFLNAGEVLGLVVGGGGNGGGGYGVSGGGGGGGSFVYVLDSGGQVPEPGTLALVALGLALSLTGGRRKVAAG